MGNCNCASAKGDEPVQHQKPKGQAAAVKQNGAKGAPHDLEVGLSMGNGVLSSVPMCTPWGDMPLGGRLTTEPMSPCHAAAQSIHHAIRLLGRGAAADTWLCADRAKKRLVAVKLFPRPLPHVQRESVVREITVRAWSYKHARRCGTSQRS